MHRHTFNVFNRKKNLLLINLSGNILVIATLISKRKQLSSTNLYLVTLAVSDLMVCFIGQLCRAFPRALTGYDTGTSRFLSVTDVILILQQCKHIKSN